MKRKQNLPKTGDNNKPWPKTLVLIFSDYFSFRRLETLSIYEVSCQTKPLCEVLVTILSTFRASHDRRPTVRRPCTSTLMCRCIPSSLAHSSADDTALSRRVVDDVARVWTCAALSDRARHGAPGPPRAWRAHTPSRPGCVAVAPPRPPPAARLTPCYRSMVFATLRGYRRVPHAATERTCPREPGQQLCARAWKPR